MSIVLKVEENRTLNPFRQFLLQLSAAVPPDALRPFVRPAPSRAGVLLREKAAPIQHHCDHAGVNSSSTVFVN